ncbi:MAG: SdrD B-like domain-containing protein [Planctomycetaceae bacterium]
MPDSFSAAVWRRWESPTRIAKQLWSAGATQSVSGAAEFDFDQNGVKETARNQRFDVLAAAGLTTDGAKIVITGQSGGSAFVDAGGTVVFEFAAGSVDGSFQYSIVDDRLDSDAISVDDNSDGRTDRAVISFTTGPAGATDHSLDFGLVTAGIDLELSKTADRTVAVEGDRIRMTVVVCNTAAAGQSATGVTIRDILPTGLTLVPGSVQTSVGTFSGSTWTLSNPLLPSHTATLSYLVTVNSGTVNSVLISAAEVMTANETDADSQVANDDGDRSQDDEDDAVVLVGTLTNSTVTNTAQVIAADQVDFDSVPNNDDHDQSEDDESAASFTLSTAPPVFSIGDLVWGDTDSDGMLDAGTEFGLAGLTVRLTGDVDGDGVSDTRTTVTDSNGRYIFSGVNAGTYVISVTAPTSQVATFDLDGGNNSSATVTVTTTSRMDVDFGYRGTGTIGDLVWTDTNANGVQDSGETGIDGITVQLDGDTNADGIVETRRTTTTNSAGLYEFTNLPPGRYSITVTPPVGNVQTFDADGLTTANISTVTLAAGATVRTQDFGYRLPVVNPSTVDLAVTIDNNNVLDQATTGSLLTYTVTVTNSGPDAAANAILTTVLPSQLTAITWTALGSNGTVFVGSGSGNLSQTVSLPAGGTIVYTVQGQLNSTFKGSLTSTAVIGTTQAETVLTNNSATDVTTVSGLTLSPETPLIPGQPFELGARGMQHVSLVSFIVGTRPGTGVINGVVVGIADPQVFMVGFVCVDDRIIGVYDVPTSLNGQKLYFQAYENSAIPNLSAVVEGTVGGPRVIAAQTGGVAAVTEGSTTDSFSVKLSQAPTSPVTVEVQNSLPTRLTLSASTLTFTAANWNVAQTVQLQAIDNTEVNGNETAVVQLMVRRDSDATFVGSFSPTFSVSISDNEILQVPGLLNGFTSTQEARPAIRWSAVPGAVSYDVWFSSTTSVKAPLINTSVIGTTLIPTEDVPIGRYAVWVRARGTAGQISAWSNSARIDITTVPTIAPLTTGSATPTISWNAVAGAARYELWVNNLTTGAKKVIHATDLTATSLTPSSALPFGNYAAWVRAVESSGRSGDWSAVQRFNVGPAPVAPASGTFERRPTFTWSSVTGVASVEIFIRTVGGVIRQAGLTGTSFTPATDLPEGAIRWWVRGTLTDGRIGGWSVAADSAIGGRPAIVSPAASSTITANTAFTFQWTRIDQAIRYDLFVSQISGLGIPVANLPQTILRNDTLSTNSLLHPFGLTAGTYRIWVRAISGTGQISSWSVPVTLTVTS